MRKKGWGRIVNTASVHGLVASVEKGTYVAAKHGLIGLTKVVGAGDRWGSGITCNAICPGWVLTPLVQRQIDAPGSKRGDQRSKQAKLELLAEKQPKPRVGRRPSSWAISAVFLCSSGASTDPWRRRSPWMAAGLRSRGPSTCPPRPRRSSRSARRSQLIRDGDAVATTGFVGIGVAGRAARRPGASLRGPPAPPRDLTLILTAGAGDSKDLGLNRARP